MGALRLRLRDWHRAAALAGLASLAFFTYGHVYDVLKNVEVMGGLLGRHRYLIPASLALIGMAAWRIVRLRDGRQLTRTLNVVAIALVALPVLQLALYQVQLRRGQASARTEAGALVGRRPDRPPDIYYIVLDAYARQDVLRSRFGIDNTAFLDGLRDLGFQVAECAQSNYAQTELTLATTLNLDYLDRLGDFPASGHDRTPLLFLVRESAVRQILERMGYQVYAFETGYAFSEWQDADVYLHPPRQGVDFPLTAFEGILLESTALTILIDARSILPPSLGGALEGPLDVHRERVLFDLDTLPRLAGSPGPKFVFAHIVAPHRPYLFAPQADSATAQQALLPDLAGGAVDGYILGYRNQVLYLNDRAAADPAALDSGFARSADHPAPRGSWPGRSHRSRTDGDLERRHFPRARPAVAFGGALPDQQLPARPARVLRDRPAGLGQLLFLFDVRRPIRLPPDRAKLRLRRLGAACGRPA